MMQAKQVREVLDESCAAGAMSDLLRKKLSEDCPSSVSGVGSLGENSVKRIDFSGVSPNLVWLNAAPGYEDEALEGLESVYPGEGVPLTGGTAADNGNVGEWKQWCSTPAGGSSAAAARNPVLAIWDEWLREEVHTRSEVVEPLQSRGRRGSGLNLGSGLSLRQSSPNTTRRDSLTGVTGVAGAAGAGAANVLEMVTGMPSVLRRGSALLDPMSARPVAEVEDSQRAAQSSMHGAAEDTKTEETKQRL